MDNGTDVNDTKDNMKCKSPVDTMESEDEPWGSEEDDETIARIQRAHFAQTAAMSRRRRPPPKPRPMSQKRKMEAVKNFHDFTKKLKKDTGIKIRSLSGENMLGFNVFSSSDSDSHSDSDGLSEEEFSVDPQAAQELNEENESFLDPETGDIIENKVSLHNKPLEPHINADQLSQVIDSVSDEPKTLTINDIINEGDLDLTKNVEIAEVEQGELCSEKTEDLLDLKQEDGSQDFDITDKLKEMGEISVKSLKKDDSSETKQQGVENMSETDEEVFIFK